MLILMQMPSTYIYSEPRKEELKLWPYVPMMSVWIGIYLRLIRSAAYIYELVWKKSYDDPWNPVKPSSQAKANEF